MSATINMKVCSPGKVTLTCKKHNHIVVRKKAVYCQLCFNMIITSQNKFMQVFYTCICSITQLLSTYIEYVYVVTLFQKKQCIFRCYDLFLIGDTIDVSAKIHNSSSKKVKPKVSLMQLVVYRATGSRTTSGQCLWKYTGDSLENKEGTISCQVKIPNDALCTLANCDIISVTYILKVGNNVVVMVHQLK